MKISSKIFYSGASILVALFFIWSLLDNLFFVHFLSLFPEAVLEKMYDKGFNEAYQALVEKQYHAPLTDRVIFFTRMADKGAPGAVCEAAGYLEILGKRNEERKLLEKYSRNVNNCNAKIKNSFVDHPKENGN